MSGALAGLDWPAFLARLDADGVTAAADRARASKLAQAMEAGVLTGAHRRAARESAE